MKKYFFIALASLSLVACNQAEMDKAKADLNKSSQEIDSLKAYLVIRDNSINDFVSYFNDVESNLDSITAKQHIILFNADKQTELKKDKKERINEQIEAINDLMSKNYTMVADLTKKLSSSGYKNSQLQKTIVMLNDQLAQKDIELANLNDKLNTLSAEIVQLQTDNELKSQNIAAQTETLHTAYYVIGKSKELQGSKIIDREGGLLGIGKISKMNENVDNSKFTKIDYTKMSKIPINGDDVKIVTTHPSDSYTLDKDLNDKDMVNYLIITNPEKFWSASKYLVIVKG